jgi:hypothetical protein
VSVRADVRRAAPWVLCAISLGAYTLTSVLRWRLGDQLPAGDPGWLGGTVGALGFAGIPVVGALIATRWPGNPIGWLWCAAGLANAMSDAAPIVAAAGRPHWLAFVVSGWGFVCLVGLLVFLFLLFPTGGLPSRRWRWVARAAVPGVVLLVLAVPFIRDSSDPGSATPWALGGEPGRYLRDAVTVAVYSMVCLALAAMASLVPRFRRAGPVERRQLTWFLYAAALNALIIVLDVPGLIPPGLFDLTLNAVGYALLPVAVGIAMFRYRLYEIDRIVSRTVSYGVLSAGLVGLYLLVVALLRPLLEPLTGSSALAVAASTLAVAAAFNPARRRLQAAVDRRFDRARYDAARAVDGFAARLRDQVDLGEITTSLCETVKATVGPGRVSVWLRPAGRD